MNAKILTILSVVMFIAAGCGKEHDHEFWDSEYGDVPAGYMAYQLIWDDHADSLSKIDNVKITVTGHDALTKNYDFSSPQDAANEIYQFPEGSYNLLVEIDMAEKDNFTVSQEAIPGDGSLPLTNSTLKTPPFAKRQAWFGVTSATVKNNQITIAQFTSKRLLSTFSVKINGVPDGTTMSVDIFNMAQSVELTTGRPSADKCPATTLGNLVKDGAAMVLTGNMIMPTANGDQNSSITLTTTTPDGETLVSKIDAPIMESGKSYVLEFDYEKLSPYIHISGSDINDWQQDWTTDGEILLPD